MTINAIVALKGQTGAKEFSPVNKFSESFLCKNCDLRYTSAVHESDFLDYNMDIMWLAG